MTWAAIGGGLVSVAGGLLANRGNKKAADAANKGQQAGIDEIRRQFDLSRQDQAPWLDAGKWALPKLQATFDGDYSGFFNSPDYLATQEQGLKTLDMGAGARGGLFGGGNTRDTIKYGQGLAATQLGAYRGGLGTLAGYGQNSAQSLGAMGQQMAGNIAGSYGQMGQNRASAYQNNAYNNAAMATNIGSMFSDWGARKRYGGQGGWGAFTPNTGGYNGSSAFGPWGQGWGG